MILSNILVNAKKILSGLLEDGKKDGCVLEEPEETTTAVPLSEDEDDQMNEFLRNRRAEAASHSRDEI